MTSHPLRLGIHVEHRAVAVYKAVRGGVGIEGIFYGTLLVGSHGIDRTSAYVVGKSLLMGFRIGSDLRKRPFMQTISPVVWPL